MGIVVVDRWKRRWPELRRYSWKRPDGGSRRRRKRLVRKREKWQRALDRRLLELLRRNMT